MFNGKNNKFEICEFLMKTVLYFIQSDGAFRYYYYKSNGKIFSKIAL